MIEGLGGRAESAHLQEALGFSPEVIRQLVKKGLVETEDEVVSRDPYAAMPVGEAPRLTPTEAQAGVIQTLVDASRTRKPGTFLLRGVTGSGKTLVYIELLREVVERQGKTAIVLVPEISLTPQTVGRFKARVRRPRGRAALRALSDGERYDEWRSLRAGEKRIVVGARSAIFAPLDNLGAVIVDEEHEGSYKQGEAPRYHAREVAVVRSMIEGAVCVLGSATPSLESWTNAQGGKVHLLELPERVGGQPLPPIRIIDLQAERKRVKATTGPLQEPAPVVLSRHAGGRGARADQARGADHPAAEPPRLRDVRAVPGVRAGVALPAVQRVAHLPPAAGAAHLPLLPARGGSAQALRGVRIRRPQLQGGGDGAGGARGGGDVPGRPHRADGRGHHGGASGRTTPSWGAWSGARWTSCSARR